LSARAWESLLAWYFVSVWGSGFLATKIGLQHAAPFTFLSLRFAFGIVCLTLLVIALKPRWPATRGEFGHVIIAGLLMHAVHLGGSHYAQYLGLSAGITAVLLSVQPLLTAIFAGRWMRERLSSLQWLGIAIGLAGVKLIVNAFHTLMRRGQATRVTSLIYLTPIFAVALELLMFDVLPSVVSLAGIVITCLGVAMVSWARPGRAAA